MAFPTSGTPRKMWYSKFIKEMSLKPGPIQIFVSNVERAKRWYTDVLGMQLVQEYPDMKCVLMKLDNTEFDIGTPVPKWGEGWNSVTIGGRTPISFETNHIEVTVSVLKQKGIVFAEEISKRPWGEYKAVFCDPDGNEFNLIQSD